MFLEALAAGALLGMLYDLCRVLRERWRRRAAAALLDFGFWITVCGTLFLFAILRGDGQVRLYHGVAFAAGAGGIFCNVKPHCAENFPDSGGWMRLFVAPAHNAASKGWNFG